jgi:hypothetical protein
MGIRKVDAKKARGMRGSTNLEDVKNMTDEDIEKAAILDPDSHELRSDELAYFRREKHK